MWEFRIESRFSRREKSILSHWAISPAPTIDSFLPYYDQVFLRDRSDCALSCLWSLGFLLCVERLKLPFEFTSPPYSSVWSACLFFCGWQVPSCAYILAREMVLCSQIYFCLTSFMPSPASNVRNSIPAYPVISEPQWDDVTLLGPFLLLTLVSQCGSTMAITHCRTRYGNVLVGFPFCIPHSVCSLKARVSDSSLGRIWRRAGYCG